MSSNLSDNNNLPELLPGSTSDLSISYERKPKSLGESTYSEIEAQQKAALQKAQDASQQGNKPDSAKESGTVKPRSFGNSELVEIKKGDSIWNAAQAKYGPNIPLAAIYEANRMTPRKIEIVNGKRLITPPVYEPGQYILPDERLVEQLTKAFWARMNSNAPAGDSAESKPAQTAPISDSTEKTPAPVGDSSGKTPAQTAPASDSTDKTPAQTAPTGDASGKTPAQTTPADTSTKNPSEKIPPVSSDTSGKTQPSDKTGDTTQCPPAPSDKQTPKMPDGRPLDPEVKQAMQDRYAQLKGEFDKAKTGFEKEHKQEGLLGMASDFIHNVLGTHKEDENPFASLWSHIVNRKDGSEDIKKCMQEQVTLLSQMKDAVDKNDLEKFSEIHKNKLLTGGRDGVGKEFKYTNANKVHVKAKEDAKHFSGSQENTVHGLTDLGTATTSLIAAGLILRKNPATGMQLLMRAAPIGMGVGAVARPTFTHLVDAPLNDIGQGKFCFGQYASLGRDVGTGVVVGGLAPATDILGGMATKKVAETIAPGLAVKAGLTLNNGVAPFEREILGERLITPNKIDWKDWSPWKSGTLLGSTKDQWTYKFLGAASKYGVAGGAFSGADTTIRSVTDGRVPSVAEVATSTVLGAATGTALGLRFDPLAAAVHPPVNNPGDANTPPAGDANTPPAGDANTPPAGDANTPPAGDANTPPAGDANTPPAGDANTPPAGNDNSKAIPPELTAVRDHIQHVGKQSISELKPGVNSKGEAGFFIDGNDRAIRYFKHYLPEGYEIEKAGTKTPDGLFDIYFVKKNSSAQPEASIENSTKQSLVGDTQRSLIDDSPADTVADSGDAPIVTDSSTIGKNDGSLAPQVKPFENVAQYVGDNLSDQVGCSRHEIDPKRLDTVRSTLAASLSKNPNVKGAPPEAAVDAAVLEWRQPRSMDPNRTEVLQKSLTTDLQKKLGRTPTDIEVDGAMREWLESPGMKSLIEGGHVLLNVTDNASDPRPRLIVKTYGNKALEDAIRSDARTVSPDHKLVVLDNSGRDHNPSLNGDLNQMKAAIDLIAQKHRTSLDQARAKYIQDHPTEISAPTSSSGDGTFSSTGAVRRPDRIKEDKFLRCSLQVIPGGEDAHLQISFHRSIQGQMDKNKPSRTALVNNTQEQLDPKEAARKALVGNIERLIADKQLKSSSFDNETFDLIGKKEILAEIQDTLLGNNGINGGMHFAPDKIHGLWVEQSRSKLSKPGDVKVDIYSGKDAATIKPLIEAEIASRKLESKIGSDAYYRGKPKGDTPAEPNVVSISGTVKDIEEFTSFLKSQDALSTAELNKVREHLNKSQQKTTAKDQIQEVAQEVADDEVFKTIVGVQYNNPIEFTIGVDRLRPWFNRDGVQTDAGGVTIIIGGTPKQQLDMEPIIHATANKHNLRFIDNDGRFAVKQAEAIDKIVADAEEMARTQGLKPDEIKAAGQAAAENAAKAIAEGKPSRLSIRVKADVAYSKDPDQFARNIQRGESQLRRFETELLNDNGISGGGVHQYTPYQCLGRIPSRGLNEGEIAVRATWPKDDPSITTFVDLLDKYNCKHALNDTKSVASISGQVRDMQLLDAAMAHEAPDLYVQTLQATDIAGSKAQAAAKAIERFGGTYHKALEKVNEIIDKHPVGSKERKEADWGREAIEAIRNRAPLFSAEFEPMKQWNEALRTPANDSQFKIPFGKDSHAETAEQALLDSGIASELDKLANEPVLIIGKEDASAALEILNREPHAKESIRHGLEEVRERIPLVKQVQAQLDAIGPEELEKSLNRFAATTDANGNETFSLEIATDTPEGSKLLSDVLDICQKSKDAIELGNAYHANSDISVNGNNTIVTVSGDTKARQFIAHELLKSVEVEKHMQKSSAPVVQFEHLNPSEFASDVNAFKQQEFSIPSSDAAMTGKITGLLRSAGLQDYVDFEPVAEGIKLTGQRDGKNFAALNALNAEADLVTYIRQQIESKNSGAPNPGNP
jgi:hypothetical protein